jgi:hypothetical protein
MLPVHEKGFKKKSKHFVYLRQETKLSNKIVEILGHFLCFADRASWYNLSQSPT